MSQSLVPYSFTSPAAPPFEPGEALPGQVQVVHFVVEGDVSWLIEKMELWFEERDEVVLVAQGMSAAGFGFVVLEWQEAQVDRLFLDILKHEPAVDDFMVYARMLEE